MRFSGSNAVHTLPKRLFFALPGTWLGLYQSTNLPRTSAPPSRCRKPAFMVHSRPNVPAAKGLPRSSTARRPPAARSSNRPRHFLGRTQRLLHRSRRLLLGSGVGADVPVCRRRLARDPGLSGEDDALGAEKEGPVWLIRLLTSLVVVAAVCVVVATALPFTSPRLQPEGGSPRERCLSNLKQLGLAVAMYADQNQGRCPMDSANPTLVGSMRLLSNVLMSVKVFHCPEDHRPGQRRQGTTKH